MNDEIKEILDILKNCKDYDDEVFLIKQHSATLLYNYITILQQDNTMYAQLKDEYEEEIKNLQKRNSRQRLANQKQQELILKLQQENERLKKPNYYEKGLIGSIKERDKIIQDYKSRCEKANAELKNWEKLDLDNLLVAISRTQNILQNGSENDE